MYRRLSLPCLIGLVIALGASPARIEAAASGDVNGSGVIDVSDAVYLLDWLFRSGPDPVACDGAGPGQLNGDVNGDGSIDISDPTYLLVMLFRGGPGPAPCGGSQAPHTVRPFEGHAARAMTEFASTCSSCHAVEPPSPLAAAPACVTCHTGGSPFTFTSCTSCHGSPPDGQPPVGETHPNLPGAHAVHLALSSIAGACDTCHAGGGSGAGLAHYYDGTVTQAAADATYDANAGAMVFRDNRTCGNVSCHGGIDTPDWDSGSIAVTTNTGCARCHQNGTSSGSPEANSPWSGRHVRHRNEGIGCTTCHDMAGDANHFDSLDTAAIEGPVRYTNTDAVFDGSTRRCSGSCHGENHSGDRW